jgi:hypothetical protein
VVTLRKQTNAHLALCSIPILGEQLDAVSNENVRLFNGVIRALPDELDVAYLPVYETMENNVQSHLPGAGRGYEKTRSSSLMLKAI